MLLALPSRTFTGVCASYLVSLTRQESPELGLLRHAALSHRSCIPVDDTRLHGLAWLLYVHSVWGRCRNACRRKSSSNKIRSLLPKS